MDLRNLLHCYSYENYEEWEDEEEEYEYDGDWEFFEE